jgi:hypothetical protein
MQEPWMWVKELGGVIAMFANGNKMNAEVPSSSSSNANETTTSAPGSSSSNEPAAEVQAPSSPMKDPPTPWPSQMAQLESVGAGHWDSVRALNMTNGDTKAAGDMLGVGDLINQILGETQGIVNDVLASVSAI